jgi:hypothetical protein
MEEVRAAAGGVVVNTHAQNYDPARTRPIEQETPISQKRAGPHSNGYSSGRAPMAPRKDFNSTLQQITQAKEMYENGIISDAEFQEMKAKIISQA